MVKKREVPIRKSKRREISANTLDKYYIEGKSPPFYWKGIYWAAVFFEDILIQPHASLSQKMCQKGLKSILVSWGSLLAQSHGTSQQPVELQTKDEVLELTNKTVNIIRQGIKDKEIKVRENRWVWHKKYNRRRRKWKW